MFYSFFFFFSSRRRHTRSDRDWSSDVCSSDLLVDGAFESGLVLGRRLGETAHLAHELARGGANLLVGRDVIGVAQSLDASTHVSNDRRRRVSGGGAAAAREGRTAPGG